MDEIDQDAVLNKAANRIAEGLRGTPYDDLLAIAAAALVAYDGLDELFDEQGALLDDALAGLQRARQFIEKSKQVLEGSITAGVEREIAVMTRSIDAISRARKSGATKAARAGANALHDKPGGSRDKVAKIRAAWASGNYRSRTECAEIGGRELGMSYDAARRALRNTPDPA